MTTGNGYILETTPATPWVGSVWTENEGSSKSEIGDPCDGERIRVDGFLYQRLFSNEAAAKGGDFCMPSTGLPYFSVSELPNEAKGWYETTAGGSVTIPIVGWSTAPVADWEVTLVTEPESANFQATIDTGTTVTINSVTHPTMNNGRQATLTVAVPSSAPSGFWGAVLLNSTYVGGASELGDDTYHQWVVGVYVP
jgi:hypothetical protein